VLSGCASSPEQKGEPEKAVVPVEKAVVQDKVQPKDRKTSINPDVLFMLLTAELAGQRGQYDIALEGYLEAAKRVHDPRFAERAAMIAIYVNDNKKASEAMSLWLHQDPNNLTARKFAALSSLRKGDKQAAADHMEVLLRSDPAGFEKSLLELAEVLQKANQPASVFDALEIVAQRHPEQATVYFVQSLLAIQMHKQDLAEIKIQKALSIQPDWDKALIFRAQIAAYVGDFNKAKAVLQEASAKYPKDVKIKKLYAQVLIKAKDYASAGQVYQDIINADPKDDDSRFALGLVYLQQDEDDQAEQLFKKLLGEVAWRNQASFYLGKLEEKRGNKKEALIWFDKVTEGAFVYEASLSAITVLIKNDQFVGAESRLRALDSKFPKQRVRTLLVRAELLNQQKKYQEAFVLLTDALLEMPEEKELLYTRALMADHLGRIDVLESDLKKILQEDPGNAEALNALGYSLADKTTRYTEAQQYLQKALNISPEEAVILDSYGWLKFKLGDYAQALEYLQKAYAKQQENEIAAHLAEVLWVLDRKEEAKDLIDKAIKNSPDDDYLLDFQKRILNKVE
jgi:tetratricopeptide (TPR) repeat protein